MAPHETDKSETKVCHMDKFEIKTREDRLNQQHVKCNRIIQYLRHGKHLEGLNKNQQRVVRGQAKNYIWDETSKLTFFWSETFCLCCPL